MIDKNPSAFRTISEVADEIGVAQHVLRFWETKFAAVKPMKRGGNRRYYRPEDVDLLRTINRLLYADGYTIKGVQKLLRDKGQIGLVSNDGAAPAPPQAPGVPAASLLTMSPATRGVSMAPGFLGSLQGIRERLASAVSEARTA